MPVMLRIKSSGAVRSSRDCHRLVTSARAQAQLARAAWRTYAARTMSKEPSAPHEWIDPLAMALARRLDSVPVQGAISGPGWLSLRTEEGFLWFYLVRGARMAWLADHPLSQRWLDLLGRHSRSPFAGHLREGRISGVFTLRTREGTIDGLRIHLEPGGRQLNLRSFPRPGAIWLDTTLGKELARFGRMQGPALSANPPQAPALELASHAESCEALLTRELLTHTAGRLEQQVRQAQKKLQRRAWTLEGDLDRSRKDLSARALADLLASHLHEIRVGMASVRLIDFVGQEQEIELDPALPPAVNLDRWYRRAAKTERSVEQIERRLEETTTGLSTVNRQLHELKQLPTDSTESLDRWLDFAESNGLDPRPRDTTASAQRRAAVEDRMPYWTFRCGEWEIRVGRSASDNDELTLRHSHLRDMWLHAQGVAGSHVVIRSAGRPVPKDILEDAARIAAQYSKSKTSSTVAVHAVERRYVRKPRKAPAGTVKLERAQTLFVEPGIPERWSQE
jgi:hypothetical protein